NARTLLNTLKQLNEELATTILMVTHDPMSASYCQRILFIKDGLIHRELKRGESQQDFYQEILEVLSEAEVEQVIE
ncbi:MAG: bacitracin ABC transporter ATP-binding protein, partial [Vagococcus sp.]|nr:bacitracin ABC transporter ATP-binding protein [Vagococcus sp.]